MEATLSPSRLLSLPAELRNKIYEEALSSTISISQMNIDTGLPNNPLGLPRVSRQLYREALPILWSCTVFETGYRSYSNCCETRLYRWLRDVVRDAAKHIRQLRIVALQVCLHHHTPRQMYWMYDIHIDLDKTGPNDAVTVGRSSGCGHEPNILLDARRVVSNIPRVDGRPLVTDETIWDLVEVWKPFHLRSPRRRRSWVEFKRAYELHLSKEDRQIPWNDERFLEMEREVIHGVQGGGRETEPGASNSDDVFGPDYQWTSS